MSKFIITTVLLGCVYLSTFVYGSIPALCQKKPCRPDETCVSVAKDCLDVRCPLYACLRPGEPDCPSTISLPSDCMLPDCTTSQSRCGNGKLCCPTPCGGTWCAPKVDKNSTRIKTTTTVSTTTTTESTTNELTTTESTTNELTTTESTTNELTTTETTPNESTTTESTTGESTRTRTRCRPKGSIVPEV